MSAPPPLVIEVKVNEMAVRADNPNVPYTPDEIAEDVAACAAAGATLVHFHPRTADGAADHSASASAQAVRVIRRRCEIVVLPAAANRPGAEPAQRLANLVDNAADRETRTDLLAVEMGDDDAAVEAFCAAAREHGFGTYLATLNVGWTRGIERALDDGLLEPPLLVGLVLGGARLRHAHPATLAGLAAHRAFLPAVALQWTVCAHGANALAIAAAAIAEGGHVGIGLGDHPYRELGTPTNADLVRRVVELAADLGRPVATPDQARELLGVAA
jgi:3-keto-5-aminohexanoate cleavage enzyme